MKKLFVVMLLLIAGITYQSVEAKPKDAANYSDNKAIELFMKALRAAGYTGKDEEAKLQKAVYYFQLGEKYIASGSKNEGFELFKKALRAAGATDQGIEKREKALNFFQLASHSLDSGYYDDALEQLLTALRIDPSTTRSGIYMSMGLCYSKIGNYKKAIELYRRSLIFFPQASPLTFNLMAYAYGQEGDIDTCIKYYKLSAGLGNEEAQRYLNEHGINW